MAAKHKQKNKHKTSKIRFSPADRDEDMEPEDGDRSGAEEESDGVEGKDGNNEKDEFNLEEVLKLGGTQADFVMLSAVDETNELVDGGKKGAIDDLEEGELEKFIVKLGIRGFSGQQIIADEDESPKEKKVNDKKAKNSEKQAEPKEKKQEKKNKNISEKPISGETSSSAENKPKELKKPKGNVFEFTKRSVLLIRPGGKWFDLDYTSESGSELQDPDLVSRYKALAQQLLEAEEELYRTKKSLQRGANSGWMKTVVSAGVLADRLAAMTVLIQDSPVHSLQHLQTLVSMVKKKGSRRMGLMAIDTIRELLLSDLLPESRKLRNFHQRPISELEERASGNRDARDRRLVLWLFEHQLKNLVAEFVSTLESVSHDSVPATKAKALSSAFELLSQRPEQEKALLTQIVNKLGDPEYKLAAKASYLLETVLHRHPNMKSVVCAEVERLLFRANIGVKAQYYAVCFLSQVILCREDSDLAARLIGIYFSFFGLCVKRRQVHSKMLSALLSGVNRAYPFAAAGDEAVRGHMGELFSVVHKVKFNTAVQALMLLFQVMDSQQSVSDRFYCALYRKLLDPGLSSCSRQSMFLNLLYKSLKADTVLRRVKAFVKRLLQVSAEQGPSFTCGALFLLSEVLKNKPALRSFLDTPEEEEEEAFKDLPDDDDDDEEEVFRDAPDEEEAPEGGAVESTEGAGQRGGADEKQQVVDTDKPQSAVKEERPSASWVHQHNMEGARRGCHGYDPLHRNPLFCGADHCSLWELRMFASHYHPSVSLFAKTILQGDSVSYSGDPLQDFTLIRFLDRFVFRNPKQLKEKQSESVVLQPKKKNTADTSVPVNSEEFVSKDESQIPVDQIFFHRYFVKRRATLGVRRVRDGDTESIEDVDDDEFEKILDSCEGDSYFSQMNDDQLDFAGNVGQKQRKSSAPDSDSDLDSDLDLDDEEVELSLDEEDFGEEFEEEGGAFMDLDEDDDEEVPELDEDFQDSEEEIETKPQKKRKRSRSADQEDSGSKAKKKKKGKSDAAMFTSAEEFGSLLDENSGSKVDQGGLNALRNTDRAGLKQLKWEEHRDDWIHDRDAKTLRRKKTSFNRKKKPFGTGNKPGNRKSFSPGNRKSFSPGNRKSFKPGNRKSSAGRKRK